MLNPALKPAEPVNPAERAIADAVLCTALLEIHPVENFEAVFLTLKERYPNLGEELFERLWNEQEARLNALQADNCKVIKLFA